MKKVLASLTLSLFWVLMTVPAKTDAQILKKIKDEVKSRAERKAIGKAGETVDKTIDRAVAGKAKKAGEPGEDTGVVEPAEVKKPQASDYKNYDFVAGDKIIFQPDLSNEANAELPARFVIKTGTAEVQTFNGEKVLHLQPDANTSVAPLISPRSYLPAQFTLEFDMMYENDDQYFRFVNYFQVHFHGKDDTTLNGLPLFRFLIENNSRASLGGPSAAGQLFGKELDQSMKTGNTWHHIAIYVRNNIGKAYIDQYRVAASNSLPTGAASFKISIDRYGVKIKNLRLAAGGDDKYNRIVTEGRFVTHGILFDVNKASIKPESMGTLNEIAKMMNEHKDLRFEIEGHTDADGRAEANLKLSLDRANAVKEKLVEMGIEAARFSTKGLGSTKPLDNGNSAEAKANNRRVEFVQQKS